MASTKPAAERQYVETGGEPEYFCTHTRAETAGNGNVRVFCYAEKRRNEFHLLYTVVIPSRSLAEIARRGLAASADAHNLAEWESDGEGH